MLARGYLVLDRRRRRRRRLLPAIPLVAISVRLAVDVPHVHPPSY
jgi:hypothetical protein